METKELKEIINGNNIRNNLSVKQLKLTSWWDNFSKGQKEQIDIGINSELNVEVYANPKFNESQMEEIRYGLENNVDVSIYAKPEFDYLQMREIRKGLENNIDVSNYALVDNDWTKMIEERLNLTIKRKRDVDHA